MRTVSSLGVNRAGRRVNHPPQSSSEVKESVELYLYSPPSVPSWPVTGRTLPFTLPRPYSYFLKIHFNINHPPTPRSSKWFLIRFPYQNPVIHAALIPSWYDHRNIWWEVHFMELITQFPLSSRYFFPLWPKYLPQHPNLEHPQCIFFP
jgi:hypothetical protein